MLLEFEILDAQASYQVEVDGRPKRWVVIDGDNDGTVAHDRNDHVDNAKNYLERGDDSQRRKTRTAAVTRVVVLAEVEFENVNR